MPLILVGFLFYFIIKFPELISFKSLHFFVQTSNFFRQFNLFFLVIINFINRNILHFFHRLTQIFRSIFLLQLVKFLLYTIEIYIRILGRIRWLLLLLLLMYFIFHGGILYISFYEICLLFTVRKASKMIYIIQTFDVFLTFGILPSWSSCS